MLRIEDLDAERCPRIYADLLEQDLDWLGLAWDLSLIHILPFARCIAAGNVLFCVPKENQKSTRYFRGAGGTN